MFFTTILYKRYLGRTCGTCVIFHEISRKLRTAKKNQPDFLIHTFRRNLLLFNNRTYPPIVYGEKSYKRNCCANSKVIKPFVFLWPFINYKKLVKKIIKSLFTAKKYSSNNRITPRCHSSNLLKTIGL